MVLLEVLQSGSWVLVGDREMEQCYTWCKIIRSLARAVSPSSVRNKRHKAIYIYIYISQLNKKNTNRLTGIII